MKNIERQQYLIWKKSRKKTQFFYFFLKKNYLVMGGPTDLNFGVFWETFVGFLKTVVLELFPKYSQSHGNSNVKSRPKFNGT